MSLHELGVKHGTDKAAHGYLPVYESMLGWRKGAGVLVEFGVQNGNSLRMWSEYLPDWLIVGVDVDLSRAGCGGMPKNVRLLNQDCRDGWKAMYADVIVDDASHDGVQIAEAYKAWAWWLLPGGVYVVEDVRKDGTNWLKDRMFGGWVREETGVGFDDVLMVKVK